MRKVNQKSLRYSVLELSQDVVHTFEGYLGNSSDVSKVLLTNIRLVNDSGLVERKTLIGHLNFPKKIITHFLNTPTEGHNGKVRFKGRVATYNHYGTTRGTIRLATDVANPIVWIQ
ncbi:MAG: hypothetical protein LAT76_00715 [Schleiferiaceae bacterium]|nr:hypothetical protein [Schleiferiaceae bacterium]